MRKRKRISNQGFSLVELIIVIAIMAILAAALAPQLIKYIDNSRKSTDVSTGQSIATAVGVALTDEAAYDAVLTKIGLVTECTYWISDCISSNTSGDNFIIKMAEIIGPTAPKPKYRGNATSSVTPFDDFAIFIKKSGSNVSYAIYPAKDNDGDYGVVAADIVYPTVGANYTD